MKKKYTFILTALAAMTLTLSIGCKEQPSQHPSGENPPIEKSKIQSSNSQSASQQARLQGKSGKILEVINTKGYTYIHVDTGTGKIWAASTEFQVKVGDSVVIPDEGLPMANYHSKSLNRDFEMVYFVSSVSVGGNTQGLTAEKQMPASHPPINLNDRTSPGMTGMPPGMFSGQSPMMSNAKKGTADIDLSDIKKAVGGKTISEIYNGKADLSGKEIMVRGKVVKFTPSIMGKNWIHLQDGSGSQGSNDLTVTTDSMAQIGDTALVSGVLTLDKDFGLGYRYEVIVQDAKVTVEK